MGKKKKEREKKKGKRKWHLLLKILKMCLLLDYFYCMSDVIYQDYLNPIVGCKNK